MHQKIHQLVEIRVFSAFPSIYKGLDENTTVPVISSVVNTTDLAGPAINITAGLDMLVKEVTKQVVNMVVNTTNITINPAIMAPTTVVSLVSTTPTSVSTIVNKVVEHLGREPSSPVATVCIYYFCETLNRVYYGTAQYTVYSILQNRILYTLPYSI